LALWLSFFSFCNSQQVNTTPNLITNSWSGVVPYSGTGAGFSGGSAPGYNSSTQTIYFGYVQSTVSQAHAISSALSGSGIQVGGVNYGFQYFNQDTARGSLSVRATLYDSSGSILSNYNHTLGQTTSGWTNFNQTQTFANPYSLSSLGNVTLSITGKDDRFWAGFYGPQVRNSYLSLNYTVDPCVGNPRYSPSCPGYNSSDMWYSGNLSSVYGSSFAINQALGFGNSGVRVHSVNWGYDYNIGGRYCSGWNLFGICFLWSDSEVSGSLDVRNSGNQVILSDNKTTSGEDISGSFRREVLLGDNSRDISTLGTANINLSTTGIATASPYIGFNFSPDICNTNPLINSQCPGYAQALFTQQCTANPLSDVLCPGYAQAYLNQQCSLSALYNPSCPGYAVAYFNQQCTVSPLYSPQCPGYAQALFTKTCNDNPLSDTKCPLYQQAYLNQQCTLNSLYSTECPSYQQAYFNQQCSLTPLYNTACPGYAEAFRSKQIADACAANPQSNPSCKGYTVLQSSSTTTITTTAVSTSVPSIIMPGSDPVTSITQPKVVDDTVVNQLIEKPQQKAETSFQVSPQVQSQQTQGPRQQARATQQTRSQQNSTSRSNIASQPRVVTSEEKKEEDKMAALSSIPGFSAYENARLPDVTFYKVEDIYKRASISDNVRAQRLLNQRSDRLHREMVDEQYRK